MENNNALLQKLNKKMEDYLEREEYDRAQETCLELCRLQGLTPRRPYARRLPHSTETKGA